MNEIPFEANLISFLSCPVWLTDEKGKTTLTSEIGPYQGRLIFENGVPLILERDGGDIYTIRVREDYSRPFYYRPIQKGYLCIAFDCLDKLVEQERVSHRTAIRLCNDLTDFLLELIRSDEKTEVLWTLSMSDRSRFRALASMRDLLDKSYPYEDYVEMVTRLSIGLNPSYSVWAIPADGMRVDREDMFDQYIQIIALISLLSSRACLLRFEIMVSLSEVFPEIELTARIDEGSVVSVTDEIIWLCDEIDAHQLSNRLHFCVEGSCLRFAICNATPEPDLVFRSKKIKLLSASLSQFIAALLMYAKTILGIRLNAPEIEPAKPRKSRKKKKVLYTGKD